MNKINYIHTTGVHNTTAAQAFIPILFEFIQPSSVIDIGCGLGTWLKVFIDRGVSDILGIDSFNVDATLLEIPLENFIEHDLREPLFLEKKYDLSLCLEVGEHLPKEKANNLIDLLTTYSDTILFSAALPFQSGQNHVNEQPFSYWVEKFNNKGFIVDDLFRERIWDDDRIDWWYRQNLFLISKQKTASQKKINDYYHPEKIKQSEHEKTSLIDQLNNEINIGKMELYNLQKHQADIFAGRISPIKGFKLFIKSLINLAENKRTGLK